MELTEGERYTFHLACGILSVEDAQLVQLVRMALFTQKGETVRADHLRKALETLLGRYGLTPHNPNLTNAWRGCKALANVGVMLCDHALGTWTKQRIELTEEIAFAEHLAQEWVRAMRRALTSQRTRQQQET